MEIVCVFLYGRFIFLIFHIGIQLTQDHLLKRLSFSPLYAVCLPLSYIWGLHVHRSDSGSVIRPIGIFVYRLYFLKWLEEFTSKPSAWKFLYENFFYLFCFWLRWVFTAVHGLSLVVASGDYSSLWCMGLSLQWPLLWLSGSRAQAQQLWYVGLVAWRHMGFS